MLDTMTITKVVGAFCGALLIYLLGGWVGDALYTTGYGEQEQAYVIDTGEDEDTEAEAEPEEEVPFMTLVAQADPADGEGAYRQCQACHVINEERNGVGPHLVNVMGREKGSVDGFGYSGALPDGNWDIDAMNAWIENPSEYAPGTSMSYNGIRDDEDRAALVAFLISNTEGFEMPDPAEASAEEAPAEEAATEEAPAEAAPAEEAPAVEDEAAAPATEAETSETAEAPATEEDATQEMAAAETTEAAPEAEASGAPIIAAYEQADADAGARVWRQCQACHVANAEQNRVGPHLVNLLGREIGSVEGFRYSGALPEGEWTLEELDAWLENPREYAQGTSMSYRGLRDVQDRADVIAYIESQN